MKMTTFMRVFVATVVLLAAAQSGTAFTITGPEAGDHVHSVDLTKCPCAPPCTHGTSTLNPDPVVHINPPTNGSQFMTIFTADQAQYPGWSAVTGATLNGILSIDEYKAVDRNCNCANGSGCFAGGARMVATYAPGDGNPDTMTFIQMWYDNYSESPPAGDFTYHIDPYPNDDTEPFYYTALERTTHGLEFVDNPCNWCSECPKMYVNRFDAYLCSWDSETKVVTVHDGWTWGYDLNCEVSAIPEPATIALVCFGLVGLAGAVRRKLR